jgi:hypothetical protein
MMQETEQNRSCCRSNVFAESSLAGNAVPLGRTKSLGKKDCSGLEQINGTTMLLISSFDFPHHIGHQVK